MKLTGGNTSTCSLFALSLLASTCIKADNQNPFDLPNCEGIDYGAMYPSMAVSIGCEPTDVKCACDNNGFLPGLVESASAPPCTPQQTSRMQKAVIDQCAKAGITVTTDPSDWAALMAGAAATSAAGADPFMNSMAAASPTATGAGAAGDMPNTGTGGKGVVKATGTSSSEGGSSSSSSISIGGGGFGLGFGGLGILAGLIIVFFF